MIGLIMLDDLPSIADAYRRRWGTEFPDKMIKLQPAYGDQAIKKAPISMAPIMHCFFSFLCLARMTGDPRPSS